ncbi:MAG: GatB/YqeY domain-containing protein [Clostridia bacterium]|nr:GatB/YqeY domain-containing protein [Clostridia bacterium]
MIIDEIKKANVQAMKDKDVAARSIYSILMNKHLLATVESRTNGKEVDDNDMIRIIQKTIKELDEECENYKKVGNDEEVANIQAQKAIIAKYLPQMLSEDEIRAIIETLEDKTVPAVMRHFKTNYNGKCEMKVVSEVLKTFN